jgi:hypothetical protein
MDRERMLALEQNIRQQGLGKCFPTEATEWTNRWRIPFQRTTADLNEEDFVRLRAMGVSLSVKEAFDGTEYFLEMTKYRSIWRGWTRVQVAAYLTSILGFVMTTCMLIYHVHSLY